MSNQSIKIGTNINFSSYDLSQFKIGLEFSKFNKSWNEFVEVFNEKFNSKNFNINYESYSKHLNALFEPILFEKKIFEYEKVNEIIDKFKRLDSTINNTYYSQIELIQNVDLKKFTELFEFNNEYNFDNYIEMINIYYDKGADVCEDDVLKKEDFSSAINNPIGFQEKLFEKSEAFKKKWFLLYIFLRLLFSLFIIAPLTQYIGSSIVTKIESAVREHPESKAAVVSSIPEKSEGVIVENVNYYYKIEFVQDDGTLIVGYVAKKNIDFIEK